MIFEHSGQNTYSYIGTELELFSSAHNWKAYWASLVQRELGVDVLEVGAGIGSTCVALDVRGVRWTGLEPDARLCSEMERRKASGQLPGNLTVRLGTLADLEKSEMFDSILYVDVLEHIADDTAELARARDHLKPGGSIIVLSPAHNWLYSEFDRQIGHYRRYDKRMLKAALPEGLAAQRMDYLDSVGLFASAANRFLLHSKMPSKAQVSTWDSLMVPVSKRIDRWLGFRVGKSIYAVLKHI